MAVPMPPAAHSIPVPRPNRRLNQPLTEAIKGQALAEAERVVAAFLRMLTGETQAGDEEMLGKLMVFGGVREFPARVKCATLVWHTLTSALAGDNTEARTE